MAMVEGFLEETDCVEENETMLANNSDLSFNGASRKEYVAKTSQADASIACQAPGGGMISPSPLMRDLSDLLRTVTEWELKVQRAVLVAYEVTVQELSDSSRGFQASSCEAGSNYLSDSNASGDVNGDVNGSASRKTANACRGSPSQGRKQSQGEGATRQNQAGVINARMARRLRQFGFDAAVCKTSWSHGGNLPGGDHQFVDIVRDTPAGRLRCICDLDFRSQFIVARPSVELQQCLLAVPSLFVGSGHKLEIAIELMCVAIKHSMAEQGLHLPPWRRVEYMKKKWLASHVRVLDDAARRGSPSRGNASGKGDRAAGCGSLPRLFLSQGKGGLGGSRGRGLGFRAPEEGENCVAGKEAATEHVEECSGDSEKLSHSEQEHSAQPKDIEHREQSTCFSGLFQSGSESASEDSSASEKGDGPQETVLVLPSSGCEQQSAYEGQGGCLNRGTGRDVFLPFSSVQDVREKFAADSFGSSDRDCKGGRGSTKDARKMGGVRKAGLSMLFRERRSSKVASVDDC